MTPRMPHRERSLSAVSYCAGISREIAPALSSLTYSAPSGPGTASAGRPQKLPPEFSNPLIRVTAGVRVLCLASQGSHITAGARGGCRSHEPWITMTAPPDHGAGILLPSRKVMPSGALWAGSPTAIGASFAQSRAVPVGLVPELATSGMLASDPAGRLWSSSGPQAGHPRARPWVTGTTSSGGWLLT